MKHFSHVKHFELNPNVSSPNVMHPGFSLFGLLSMDKDKTSPVLMNKLKMKMNEMKNIALCYCFLNNEFITMTI